MFLRKKTKLRIAYGLLTITALSIIACDADARTEMRLQSTQAERARFREPAAPLPLTPLAQSPFPEARPDSTVPGKHPVARNERKSATVRAPQAAASGIFFLTVALQVDSGAGPVAFNRGTRVRLVRQQDGKLLVTRNGTDFLIEKSQVTDDLNVLGKLARNSS